MLAVGVDGHARGWVAIALAGGRFQSAHSAPDLAAVLARYPEAAVFGVDIPIGLPASGVRACDAAARRLIGPRRSSVFNTPLAAAVAARSEGEARLAAPSLSAQAWNLVPKIREAAALDDPRLHEVHPEVSFWAMAGRHLPHPKRTWAGQRDRWALLLAQGIDLPADLGSAAAVPPDDVLDAAAAAWTAARLARGEAVAVAEPEPIGNRLATIWY